MMSVRPEELKSKVEELIRNPPMPVLVEAVINHRGLITLEDVIVHNQERLNLDNRLVQAAEATVKELKQWRR